MAFRKIRGLFVLCLLVGFAVGFGFGFMDFSERTVLRVGLALMAVAGVVGYWYRRRLQSTGELDERHRRIERRSTRAAYGVVVVGGPCSRSS